MGSCLWEGALVVNAASRSQNEYSGDVYLDTCRELLYDL